MIPIALRHLRLPVLLGLVMQCAGCSTLRPVLYPNEHYTTVGDAVAQGDIDACMNRVGRIFVDYLRNKHGATTAAAFSARARPGLGVSMPVAWEQLATLKSGAQWTISTAREHLSFQKTDPWAGYWTSRQTLTAAMKVLGFRARPAKR